MKERMSLSNFNAALAGAIELLFDEKTNLGLRELMLANTLDIFTLTLH